MTDYESQQEIRVKLETLLAAARKLYELEASVEQVAQILCDKQGYVDEPSINFIRLLIKAHDLYKANPVDPNAIQPIETNSDYEN